MTAPVAYTELDAVNLILRNMGETPVNSLSNPPLDASTALETLREVSLEVQKRGWYFNTEIVSLSPDNNGNIQLPANVLAVEAADPYAQYRVVIRNRKLYRIQPKNNGFTFVGPMDIKWTLGLDFPDLPPSASSYIAIRASNSMQVRESGDQMTQQFDQAAEARALSELQADQLMAEKLTLAASQTVYDVAGYRYLSYTL